MSWSSSAPSGISFASSTLKTDNKIWNYFSAYPLSVWTARGDGNTYYVKVTVRWKEGQNGFYQKSNEGIYWFVGSDKQNFAMPSSAGGQTYYYTGSKASSGSVTVGVSPNSNLSDSAEVSSSSLPAATYEVTYNANGGSNAPSSQTKTYNVSLTLRASSPTRTGYNFLGWATSSSSSTVKYDPGDTYTSNAALTLYAVWEKITYTVSYNKGAHGSGTNTTATKTYGVALTLKGAVFSRTGYTQTGWSTSDGGSKTYNLSASYSANASVTLYPYWTANTWTVAYNGNGSTGGSTASQTKTYGVSLTISDNGFTRTNYTFVEWNTKADGSGTSYDPGDSYTGNAALTLYAQWKKNNIPVYVNVSGTVYQVEKAYTNVGGTIKECTVYANVGGVIKTFV